MRFIYPSTLLKMFKKWEYFTKSICSNAEISAIMQARDMKFGMKVTSSFFFEVDFSFLWIPFKYLPYNLNKVALIISVIIIHLSER